MQYYDKKAVGKRIKKIRLRTGMTQCRLAEELDYTSERQLQRIESGETSCFVDKLMELAQILGVSTDYLLFGVAHSNMHQLDEVFVGKTEEQVMYLKIILETASSNLKLITQ